MFYFYNNYKTIENMCLLSMDINLLLEVPTKTEGGGKNKWE